MSLLPKSKEEFSQKEYWDTFFKKRGSKAFEWYGEYPDLSSDLHKYIKTQDNVLISGCGNSTLGRDLYDIGFRNITNIDISEVVIRQMSQNTRERDDLKYIQMDALSMSFDNAQFSVVVDKGTLDALMPNDRADTLSKVNQYFTEIQRVLKSGGRYICISLLQEHILKSILNYFPKNNWMFRATRCFEVEKRALENGENSMPVFFVVCTKFTALPRKVLELNLGSLDKMQRFENEQDIILHISSVQQAAFVCSGLKRSSIANENEVVLDLFEPCETKPRFTVHVVDIVPQHKNSQYAAFIVPQGREVEWLFSTKAGRKHLVTMTNHNRLAIITLHRGQKYESFEAVQKELTETVCNLAPSSLNNKKILFLSLGSDVGQRVIKFEGHSEYSGDYIIEDVKVDNGEKFRRLFYKNSQLVIQSEAMLRTVKSRKGITKEIVDLTYLTCNHHIYMSVAAHVACRDKKKSTVVVVGLGGGGLCSFMHKFLPKTNIIAVDIDKDMLKIATDWFAFQQNDKVTTKIQDGLLYLKETSEKGEKFDCILFDVDSKDSSVGMSCPPKQFLENDALSNVAKIIADTGLFVLNAVLRDQSVRPSVLNNLKSHFETVVSYKLEEDLNEIFICCNSKIYMDHLKDSCTQINNFFKKNNSKSNNVDIDMFMQSLVMQSLSLKT
ncbi:methyltransferase-like protein 13 [Anoplophora glabripennis]|uniref:methyltransferase-like protein 13 n=1 Tax=Anoplophora glabripennis TaxID=217634 RepID=UPI000875A879|nr:methyltransferase-like protein 13 [Anoplophora glabripennis]